MVDENQMLVNFHEKVSNPPSNLASGAIFIASPSFFRFFNKHFKNASDFSTDVIPNLLNKVNCYETNGFFIDIGTPVGLRRRAISRRAPFPKDNSLGFEDVSIVLFL